MAFMNKVLDLEIRNEDSMLVHLQGGCTLGDLIKFFAPRGLELRNIPSLPHVTVTGALATATHGSGLGGRHPAALTSQCADSEIDFVTHDGRVLSYTRKDEDLQQFHTALVHLGALGVVSRVSLEVIPSYSVDQRVYEAVSLGLLFSRFDALAKSVDSLTLGISFGQ